jgi:hypothetical protein
VLRTKLRLRLAGPDDPAVAAAVARRSIDTHAAAALSQSDGGPEAVRAALEGRLREVQQQRAALDVEDAELRRRLGGGQGGVGWAWWAVGAAGAAGAAWALLRT